MTEEVIRNYYCNLCGKKIDSKSESSIRVFKNSHGIGTTIGQIPLRDDTVRHVTVNLESGDYCNVFHFALHVEKMMDVSRGRQANDRQPDPVVPIKISELMGYIQKVMDEFGDVDMVGASIEYSKDAARMMYEKNHHPLFLKFK